MRNETGLRTTPAHRSPTDGWLGTLELPGYRAGNLVAKLDDLPTVDPDHLYFDLLLLDARGGIQDHHSGPCEALARQRPLDDRSRYVRVVAELLRHAADDERGLSAIGQALRFIRERGVDTDRLVMAADLLDHACSEQAVTASLRQLLELSLGEEEARRTMGELVADLARTSGFGPLDPLAHATPVDFDSRLQDINESGLGVQMSFLVRTIGKTRARRFLRRVTDFVMVPRPDMFDI
jgi:hypothetical protein